MTTAADIGVAAEQIHIAQEARKGSLALNALRYEERQAVLRAVATALDTHRAAILEANRKDLDVARETQVSLSLLKRLELTNSKLDTLVEGIHAIAAAPDPLRRTLAARYLDDGLVLRQQTASIGVLLIVFESRPDSLPQIAALALSSGNGLLLKGGREAEHSNAALHRVIVDAVCSESPSVPPGVIGLITTRSDVYDLLKLDDYIDLVIPRGSNAMVQTIQRSTRIPVLGHADGICHVYVHDDANVTQAVEVVIDSKLNYPAACNAAETLILHSSLLTQPYEGTTAAQYIVDRAQAAGVAFHTGPAAHAAGFLFDAPAAASLHQEYGDASMTVEVVPSLEGAIEHINTHGSHHTESILTACPTAAQRFELAVDSACVFHNCSTRFADGYRFGLGAEVGISTGRIHARGPVGVEGLLTQKWVLHPVDEVNGYATVGQFLRGERCWTHIEMCNPPS